jgi:malate dehydrogenase
MSKVTVIGAGNVGATCANVLVCNQVADEVVLLDIKEGVAEGKAMDIMQTANILGLNTTLKGVTNDYTATEGSDVVVITSGIPRKPGMTREELIGVNAGIVKSVMDNVLKHSPNAIIVCISNPMDTMTYLIHKTSGLPKNRIIGMGGALDSARFKYFLSNALGANPTEVEGIVIGGHGDTTMIPLTRFAAYRGIPASTLLDADTLQKVAADTMVGGATLTKLLGTSAWYAPGAAGAQVVAQFSTTKTKLSLAQHSSTANTVTKTFASVFPACSVATVSKKSSNLTSTTLKKLSSTPALLQFTKLTKLSLQLSNRHLVA